jgi:hypothetical protein
VTFEAVCTGVFRHGGQYWSTPRLQGEKAGNIFPIAWESTVFDAILCQIGPLAFLPIFFATGQDML